MYIPKGKTTTRRKHHEVHNRSHRKRETRNALGRDRMSVVTGTGLPLQQRSWNDLPNFADVIWDHDIEAILADCRKLGVKEFTISSTFSSLIETIAKFEELGCTLDGIVKVKERYTHFGSDEHALIPAFKMTVKEA